MADFEAAREQWERDYAPRKPEPIRYAPGYLAKFKANPALHDTPEQLKACPVCSPKPEPIPPPGVYAVQSGTWYCSTGELIPVYDRRRVR